MFLLFFCCCCCCCCFKAEYIKYLFLALTHSVLNTIFVYTYECFDCLHRFLAYRRRMCVRVYVRIGFSTHNGPCMFYSRYRSHTLWCAFCMYASYTYCVYSRTIFFNYVRHTKRNAKFSTLIRDAKELIGLVVWSVGRSLIYFQSIGFSTLDTLFFCCWLHFHLFIGRGLNASVKIVQAHTLFFSRSHIRTHTHSH